MATIPVNLRRAWKAWRGSVAPEARSPGRFSEGFPLDESVLRHPPERGRSAQQSVTVYHGSCCCCCCCLHTVGAMTGALVGGGLRRRADDPRFDPEHRIPGVHWLFDRWPRTQWIFWSSLGWVLLASLPVVALLHGLQRPSEIPLVAAAAAVMLGPVHLVFAWGLAVLRLWIKPTGSVQSHEFWALHRALGWSLLGALIGLLLMLPALSWL